MLFTVVVNIENDLKALIGRTQNFFEFAWLRTLEGQDGTTKGG